jgi:hypothetical protein
LRRRPPQLRAAPKEKKQLIPQARLYEQLRNETLRFRRYGSPLSLLTAKSGPLPPEALLERIYLRETDLVAALEERRLVIALPETDFQGAVSLDRRLGRDLAKSGADAPWRSGLATLSHDASAPEALVEAAAAALTLSETWN